jgi:hypothetical protein
MNANDAALANGTLYSVAVLRESYPDGSVALGCAQSEYDAYIAANGPGSLIGKMIVTLRGTCSRVARAIFAELNGAASALMVNNASGLSAIRRTDHEQRGNGTIQRHHSVLRSQGHRQAGNPGQR